MARQEVKLGLINNLEREELLGGFRELPWRAPLGLLTAVLLYASGDVLQLWPLAWVAMVPLAFACRGSGMLSSFLLGFVALFAAGVAQTWWLLDVEGADPMRVWIVAGALPALGFLAVESPACRRLRWWVRPLIILPLAVGCWALVPGEAELLIPLGGLIDSEYVRVVLPIVGPATVAGFFTALAWMCAELFAWHRGRGRNGWPGIAAAAVLLVLAGVDWTGVSFAPRKTGGGSATDAFIAPGEAPHVQSRRGLDPGGSNGVVLWRALRVESDEQRATWLRRAGAVAADFQATVAVVLVSPESATGYVFFREREPVASQTWTGPDGRVSGQPLRIEGAGEFRLHPAFWPQPYWASPWDIDVYAVAAKPVHPAQARWWLREQRRLAMIRGGRQVMVWPGGGAALDVDGAVLAFSRAGEPIRADIPAGRELGEPMGKARYTVYEDILAMGTPIVVIMLVLFTPLVFLKRRKRMESSALAIEEIPDDEVNLSREQTRRITRGLHKEE